MRLGSMSDGVDMGGSGSPLPSTTRAGDGGCGAPDAGVEGPAAAGAAATFADLNRLYLHAAAPANIPHVLSAFPLLEVTPYRY